jgi:hypothetical protein
VTTDKLASGAVTAGKIAAGAVGSTQVDSSQIQLRVGGTCPAGSSIRSIDPAGAVTCQTDTTYSAGAGLALTGTEFRAQGTPLANVVIVAKSGGDFTTIQAAIDSITNASADRPYLVYVAPGIYAEKVALKNFVSLEGAGQGTTIIRWFGSATALGPASTLRTASDSSVRHLTVESTVISELAQFAVAIGNFSGTSPRLNHVTAIATGASVSNHAVYSFDSAPHLEHVTAVASGGDNANGINSLDTAITMLRVTVTASEGSSTNYGIRSSASTVSMSDVIATASGGSSSYAVSSGNGSSATIRSSVLRGTTNSIRHLGGSTAMVAFSEIDGPLTFNSTCFATYDANLAPVTCP